MQEISSGEEGRCGENTTIGTECAGVRGRIRGGESGETEGKKTGR